MEDSSKLLISLKKNKKKNNANVESNLFQEKLEETMQKIVYLMQNFMIDYINDGDTAM